MIAPNPSTERIDLLCWVAGLGAVTAESLAYRRRVTIASARAMLGAAVRAGQLTACRPLTAGAALYTVTRAGLRVAALTGIEPCRVSPAGAQHMATCAHVASLLEVRYPDRVLIGERELRKRERDDGALLASATLRRAGAHGPVLHRPDLVLLAPVEAHGKPIAVEIELTVKAPRRLAAICRAWARSRHVEGALYLAPPVVERALGRAIDAAHAGERIVVIPLGALG